eukprot:scaffold4306_cov154-Cylindrotheca_fusiformis.AAC.6
MDAMTAEDLRPKDKASLKTYEEDAKRNSNNNNNSGPKRRGSTQRLRRSFVNATKLLGSVNDKRKVNRSERKYQYREKRRLIGENSRIEASIEAANSRNDALKEQLKEEKLNFYRQKQELEEELQQLKNLLSTKKEQKTKQQQQQPKKQQQQQPKKPTTNSSTKSKQKELAPSMRVDFSGKTTLNSINETVAQSTTSASTTKTSTRPPTTTSATTKNKKGAASINVVTLGERKVAPDSKFLHPRKEALIPSQ